MQGATIFHLARGLHRRKFFTTGEIVGRGLEAALLPRRRGRGPRGRRQAAARAFASSRADRRGDRRAGRGDLRRADGRPDLARHPALAQLHLDRGQRVWLVTARPIEMASIIARRLGLTGALGTVAENEAVSTPGGWWATSCTARRRPRRSPRSPHARAWTWPAARRTPTPPTTCRCSPWSVTPRAQPRRRLRAHAREMGWRGARLPDRAQGREGRARGRGGRRMLSRGAVAVGSSWLGRRRPGG